MSYRLTITHIRPYLRKGDQETETVPINSEIFKTLKAAKEFIEKDSKNKKCSELKHYKDGKDHYWNAYTSKSWFNEGTGEIDHEVFHYKVTKF